MSHRNPSIVADLISLAIPVVLLFGTWLAHRRVNTSRRKYLEEQEQYFRKRLLQTNLKTFPPGKCSDPVLVSGTAVIANNYFVSFAAGFKQVFGGEMKGYTRMCSDARRLAMVRMLQEAEAAGANAVFNVRYETATIISANNQKQSGGVELIAYGTAVRMEL
ncbi:MAG: YbjQ family protein [Lentisphaeria bacterium]|nr:YbjQ family protein [Lentisphaeria bacterium]